MEEKESHTNKSMNKNKHVQFSRSVYLILGIIEFLIGFRFIFKLLGANPNTPFVSFLYGVTDPLVFPFENIFPSPASDGSVLEPASLVAMAVYYFLALGVIKLYLVLNEEVKEEDIKE